MRATKRSAAERLATTFQKALLCKSEAAPFGGREPTRHGRGRRSRFGHSRASARAGWTHAKRWPWRPCEAGPDTTDERWQGAAWRSAWPRCRPSQTSGAAFVKRGPQSGAARGEATEDRTPSAAGAPAARGRGHQRAGAAFAQRGPRERGQGGEATEDRSPGAAGVPAARVDFKVTSWPLSKSFLKDQISRKLCHQCSHQRHKQDAKTPADTFHESA